MNSIVNKYFSSLVLLIIAFAFFTRIYQIHKPERYMFDEVYHAVTSKLIAKNDPRAYEWWNPAPEPDTAVDWLHPPYAKYTQAAAIVLFGENSFGWRISSVIFGVLVVFMTGKLSLRLFQSKPISLLSMVLVSLDGLVLVMSRIAMNDIHVTFALLCAFYLYITHRQLVERGLKEQQASDRYTRYLLYTGVAVGVAMGTKWSGIFALGSIGLFELADLVNSLWKKYKVKINSQQINFLPWFFKRILCLVLIPLLLYFGAYTHMFLQGKDLHHFRELHNQIIWYQTNLEATHPYQSRPYQWFLNLKPVWMHVDYINETTKSNVYATGNTALFWFGGVSVLVTIWVLIQQSVNYQKAMKKSNYPKVDFVYINTTLLFLLLSYFFVWLPWQFSPRIMFFYHYTPAVPLLSIMLAYWLYKLWSFEQSVKQKLGLHKVVVILVLLFVALNFVVWYPHWANIPMPIHFIDSVYFIYDGWK